MPNRAPARTRKMQKYVFVTYTLRCCPKTAGYRIREITVKLEAKLCRLSVESFESGDTGHRYINAPIYLCFFVNFRERRNRRYNYLIRIFQRLLAQICERGWIRNTMRGVLFFDTTSNFFSFFQKFHRDRNVGLSLRAIQYIFNICK